MGIMRLDKLLTENGLGSRSDVKKIIGKGRISVDGIIVKKPETKIDTEKNEICIDKRKISYEKYVYYMLNKPMGVISATEDRNDRTVIDLLNKEDRKKGIFPVGRLDKDTVGLLILTNDGGFAHNSLSPKKHISKRYYAKIEGIVTKEDIEKFKAGITIDGNYKCKKAKLEIISVENEKSEIEIEISEGKFHQIKRMFEAVGKKVFYLKRIRFGGILLDKKLEEGEYRKLSDDEMKEIRGLISI